jgi:hypothetical protein
MVRDVAELGGHKEPDARSLRGAQQGGLERVAHRARRRDEDVDTTQRGDGIFAIDGVRDDVRALGLQPLVLRVFL